MLVLGIDTSAYANAIGVVDDGRVLADAVFEARTDSLQKIVANIDATLKSAGLTLGDVQGFGVGLGPGSWTGIRVGVTVAKTLAYSTGRPVCGLPTLEALAHNAAYTAKQIIAIVSVGTKDTVYAAFYRANDGALARSGEYYVGDIAGLAALVKGPIVLVGPEANTYRRSISGLVPGIAVEAVEGIARGATVARLAASRLLHGEGDDALALTPLYLKESTAKVFTAKYANIK